MFEKETQESKCDVCGAQATGAACDTYEIEPRKVTIGGPPFRCFGAALVKRYGCNAHPPLSHTYNRDGTITLFSSHTGNVGSELRVSLVQSNDSAALQGVVEACLR